MDKAETVARAVALRVGFSGALDTMPPHDPDDPRNDEWAGVHFRPFLSAAAAAIEAADKWDAEHADPVEMELAATRAVIDAAKD